MQGSAEVIAIGVAIVSILLTGAYVALQFRALTQWSGWIRRASVAPLLLWLIFLPWALFGQGSFQNLLPLEILIVATLSWVYLRILEIRWRRVVYRRNAGRSPARQPLFRS